MPIDNYWVTELPANIMFDQETKGCLIGLSLNDACILCRNILNCQLAPIITQYWFHPILYSFPKFIHWCFG